MSSRVLHHVTAALVGLGLALGAGACASAAGPQFRVLGVNSASAKDVVFVQVTNPASRPMRLTHLDYTFASAGTTVASGEVPLERDLPAGAAIVFEVPLGEHSDSGGPLQLHGELTAQLDKIIRIFPISAIVEAGAHGPVDVTPVTAR